MIPRWAEDAAAIVILLLVFELIAGVTIAAFIHHGAREMPPPEDEP